jgi:Protein tyrosine and serine/threonine kinase
LLAIDASFTEKFSFAETKPGLREALLNFEISTHQRKSRALSENRSESNHYNLYESLSEYEAPTFPAVEIEDPNSFLIRTENEFDLYEPFKEKPNALGTLFKIRSD